MKGKVIFVIAFIVIVSSFARGEAQYSEGFTLTSDVEAKHVSFNLQKYPRIKELPIAQVSSFSQRTNDLSQTSLGILFQSWNGMSKLKHEYQEEPVSVEKEEALAFGYLKRLAERAMKERKLSGALSLAGGGLLLAVGIGALASIDEEPTSWEGFVEGLMAWVAAAFFIPSGAALSGYGIWNLAFPSSAERELKETMNIPDFDQRERASEEALSSLAIKGRTGRILRGVFWSALSAYGLIELSKESDENSNGYLGVLSCGLLALKDFLLKSRAERAYQSYLMDKEQQNKVELRAFVIPYRGIQIGIVLSY